MFLQASITLGALMDLPCPQSDKQLASAPDIVEGCSSFGQDWIDTHVTAALRRLMPVLHQGGRAVLARLGAPLPGGLLVCGPPGCGKSALVRLVRTQDGGRHGCMCSSLDNLLKRQPHIAL